MEDSYKKYILRDGIKIRRLIDSSIQKYSSITETECLEKLSQRHQSYHHLLLILLFKYKYSKPYFLHTINKEITLNEYSGRFLSQKKDLRKSAKFNTVDFFLYLGRVTMLDSGFLTLKETEYHVILDFLTLTPSMVEIENQMSEYSEIMIPERVIDPIVYKQDEEDRKDLFIQMIDGKISDTILICKDGEIHCSRLLLSLHSPYFKRYFLFKEEDKNRFRFEYSVQDMKNYLFYCFFKRLDKENIYSELIPMGKYLLDDSFVKYIYNEMICKIDEDESMEQNEKLELYENLLTYLS